MNEDQQRTAYVPNWTRPKADFSGFLRGYEKLKREISLLRRIVRLLEKYSAELALYRHADQAIDVDEHLVLYRHLLQQAVSTAKEIDAIMRRK